MQGETLICIATRRWDSLWRSTQQILWRIARDNRVFFFEPGRNPDKGVAGEMVRNTRYFFSLSSQQVTDNLTVIPCPSSMTYARQHLSPGVLKLTTPAVARLNASILVGHVRRAIRHFGIRNPQLWLYDPRQSHMIGHCDEKLVVYFNYDEFPNFVENRKIADILRRYDDDLVRRCDAVFCTGRGQYEHRRPFNANTHFIPNAVDYDNFNRALDPATTLPDDVASLPRPIIGFVGWMGTNMDANLLIKVAQAYPQGSLVLVGPDSMGDSPAHAELRALPNVHLLGKRPLPDLPRYLKAFDAALIPYVLSGYTIYAYPLKLHEYLAAGRAIVATNLPELQPFKHVVRVAQDHDEYLNMLASAIADHSAEAIEARLAVARENTWDSRVQTIYSILDPLPALNHASQPRGAS